MGSSAPKSTELHSPRVPPVHRHNALHALAQLLDLDDLFPLHVLQELRELGREARIGDFVDSTQGAPERARSAARWGLENCDPLFTFIRLGTKKTKNSYKLGSKKSLEDWRDGLLVKSSHWRLERWLSG